MSFLLIACFMSMGHYQLLGQAANSANRVKRLNTRVRSTPTPTQAQQASSQRRMVRLSCRGGERGGSSSRIAELEKEIARMKDFAKRARFTREALARFNAKLKALENELAKLKGREPPFRPPR